MKIKNVQGIICLAVIFLFANQSWAADLILYGTTIAGDMYYDRSSIEKVNKNIIRVGIKSIYNEEGKTKTFSSLKGTYKALDTPDKLNHYILLQEIDCANEKYRTVSIKIYDEKGNMLVSSPEGNTGEWNNILPNSVTETLEKIVCKEPVVPNEAVVASKVEAPVTPKEVVAAPAVTDQNLAQVDSKQTETKAIPEKAVQNLVTKWLNSWKSGYMETYRSCYASDFKLKGMNLDAWISHKTNLSQKSKNINISIGKLKISAEDNNATAVFTQYYSSSIFKDSGKKKLELRKINDEWKIYREIM